MYRLKAPSVGNVINGECSTLHQAEMFLSDRVANQQAFPGEFVARMDYAEYADNFHHLEHWWRRPDPNLWRG